MTDAYQRKCKNWLASYRSWVMPRIAAPESYIFWSGMYCLAAAIRRKVYIGKATLGSWECFPHCYIILVGPPGFRKNTSMGPGIELLQELSDSGTLNRAPAIITKESVLDSVFKSSDSSIYLTIEEFGDIFLKSGPDMFELLTTLFDAKKTLEQKTLSRNLEIAIKPCVNLLAGTTPQWIAMKMPESVIGGGLASRIIFIYEDKEPSSRIFFNGIAPEFEVIQKDLVSDLNHIAHNIEGEFLLSEETKDWMEDWNNKRKRNGNPKLAGYYARKITHILKIAQLFHLSYDDSLTIHKADIEAAIGIVEGTEKNLPRVFTGVGKNVYALDTKDILDYVNNNSGVLRSRILIEFQTVATLEKMDILLQGLVEMKLIRSQFDDEKKDIRYYQRKQDDKVDGSVAEGNSGNIGEVVGSTAA